MIVVASINSLSFGWSVLLIQPSPFVRLTPQHPQLPAELDVGRRGLWATTPAASLAFQNTHINDVGAGFVDDNGIQIEPDEARRLRQKTRRRRE